jgi:hypothetical protein
MLILKFGYDFMMTRRLFVTSWFKAHDMFMIPHVVTYVGTSEIIRKSLT